MDTRRIIAVVAVAALVTMSGCGFLLGNEALEFNASPVAVDDTAQSDTGYEETRRSSQAVERSFQVAGQTRNVSVTNYLAEYGRTAETLFSDQQVARVTVLSSPKVQVLGESFNPLGDLSDRQLAQRFQEQYGSLDDLQFQSNRTASILGSERTVSKFTAQAQMNGGTSVDVNVHISKFEDGDDFIVAVAVHPQQIDEESNVDTMFGGIVHPAAEPSE
ncbi:DUF6517 family protein [Halosegnis rubeus]|jgi:hypothetical protein|uniref:Lipoprotein n=1 Tax=Halosegnis rubeus TaxID=2212850 RepID=A0A5N5UHK3_9EURY|nr:DUF6517 family protein [Halosegnis rubeus]KAB7518168.1 hypothetical protein DMP03_02055 [Halosegnis rubeus]KAB7519259.1 hypothetical protein DP108_03880 [Halosegnis rubeus]